jgi:hypothetical protein
MHGPTIVHLLGQPNTFPPMQGAQLGLQKGAQFAEAQAMNLFKTIF